MSAARVRVALVPPAPDALPPAVCAVAIDVLRATSTLAVAVAHGATRIIPFATTHEALAHRDAHPGTLVCGERDGRIVAGFDLGNSPVEYPPERMRGATLAFASTTGSRAMLAGSRARRRRLASFVALSACVEALADEPDVVLVCAGKLGRFALEDAACAGTIAARLAARGARLDGDGARFAVTLAVDDATQVRALVEGSDHGRWLQGLGPAFAADVVVCATLDAQPTVVGW
ncbi:MAG: 2-phosphosulfolactate phosphatase [bacterium]